MSTPPTTSIGEPAELSESPVTPRLTLFGLSRDRVRVWGLKSVLSLVDQALTSGAGFAVNIFLARWLAPALYGAFAVAFAATLFVAGFHNVLLLEPLSVFGPARHASNLVAYFRIQVRLHFFLVGLLSAFGLVTAVVLRFIVPQSPATPAVVASSIALPFFLLLWLARRMCYVVQRPSLAVSGSFAYVVTMLVGLFVLRYFGKVSSFSVFLLIGATSMVASAILLWRLVQHEKSKAKVELSSREVLEENWTYGRWLFASTALFTVSTQTQTFLAAGILGLGAAGILRAMQIPSLLMTQIGTATGLLFLPSLSYDFGSGRVVHLHQKANAVSLTLCLAGLAAAAVLAMISSPVEHTLYGGKFARQSWLIPIFSLVPVATGLSMGYSMALRAFQKPQFDLVCNAVAAPVGLISAILLMQRWGLAGSAVSMVLAAASSTIVVLVIYRRVCGGLNKGQNERIATIHD